MNFDNPEQLRNVLLEATLNSLIEFQKDLERRIAVVLRGNLPQATVINMAQSISRSIGDFIELEVIGSGILNRTLDKLL